MNAVSTSTDSSFLTSFQLAIVKDVVMFPNWEQWRIDISSLETETVAKVVSFFKESGFISSLQASMYHVEGGVCRIYQDLVVRAPKNQITQKNAPLAFCPITLKAIGELAQKSVPSCNVYYTLLEVKQREVSDSYKIVKAQDPAPSCFRINIGDLDIEDSLEFQAYLMRQGFFVLRGGCYRRFSLKQAKIDPVGSQEDLFIHLPQPGPVTTPRLPSLLPQFNEFALFLDALPLTRNLTLEQRRFFLHSFPSDLQVDKFVKDIASPQGIAQMIADRAYHEKYLPIALGAFLRGRISEAEVATVALLYCMMDQLVKNLVMTRDVALTDEESRKIVYVALFSWKAERKDAIVLFKNILEENSDTDDMLMTSLGLKERGVELLKLSMQKSSFLETCVFMVSLPDEKQGDWSCMFSAIRKIYNGFFQPFERLASLNGRVTVRKFLLIPSWTILQNWLTIFYGESSVRLQPVIGDCSTTFIEEHKKKNVRVIQLGAPFAKNPQMADNIFCGGDLGFSLHDIYHARRDCDVKKNERLALLRINDLFAQALQIHPQDQDLKKLKWRLIDGELHFSKAIYPQDFGYFLSAYIKSEAYLKLILEDMVKNGEVWRREFGLTRADLSPDQQKQYDLYGAIPK